jgi:hypothetical protein
LDELEDSVEIQEELEDVVFMGQAVARVVRNERTETALMEFILSEGLSE